MPNAAAAAQATALKQCITEFFERLGTRFVVGFREDGRIMAP
jgi:hypothetical protein